MPLIHTKACVCLCFGCSVSVAAAVPSQNLLCGGSVTLPSPLFGLKLLMLISYVYVPKTGSINLVLHSINVFLGV